jgi:hypothetical protein
VSFTRILVVVLAAAVILMIVGLALARMTLGV